MTGTATYRAERDEAFVRLYVDEHLTLQEIGDRYDVTRERVRQVLNRYDIKGRYNMTRSRERHVWVERYGTLEAMRSLLDEYESMRAAAAALGVPYSWVALARQRSGMSLSETQGRSNPGRNRVFSDVTLLRFLRRTARRFGVPLGAAEYDARRHDSWETAEWPSAALYEARFGSWREACEKAGVVPTPTPRRSYPARTTPEQCVASIHRVAAILGHDPSAREYDDVARGITSRDGDVVSLATIRNRFPGGWRGARMKAIDERTGGE